MAPVKVVDFMLFIMVDLAPRSKRPNGAQSSCADPGVQAKTNERSLTTEREGEESYTTPNKCFSRKVAIPANLKLVSGKVNTPVSIST